MTPRRQICPVVLGVSAEMLAMLFVGVVFSLLHAAPYEYLPLIITAAVTVLAVYVEWRKDRCEWAWESPARRVMLYLLLFVSSFIVYSLGGWARQLIRSFWVLVPLILFVLPLVATLAVHHRFEHSATEGVAAPGALIFASRVPMYVLALYCVLVVVALIFGSNRPPSQGAAPDAEPLGAASRELYNSACGSAPVSADPLDGGSYEVQQTDLTDLERRLLGVGALTFAFFPVAFVIGLVTTWLLPSVPEWLLKVGFVLLIAYAGLLVPFLLVFEYVAKEILPESEWSDWKRRFRSSPFAFWSFWREYLS